MIKTVFFDDGGVLNDNCPREPQWKKLIHEYFIPRYGGAPEEWDEANNRAMARLFDRMNEVYVKGIVVLPSDYHEIEDREWTEDMFKYIGLELPDDPVKVARETKAWITPQIRSAYPGIIEVLRELEKEYTLYVASNGPRDTLQWYYEGMGIADVFAGVYGSDIIHAFKNTPYYFQQIVKDTGVNPEQSVMIDDKIEHLQNAHKTGFHVIHSGLAGDEPGEFPYFNQSVQLLEIIKEIGK